MQWTIKLKLSLLIGFSIAVAAVFAGFLFWSTDVSMKSISESRSYDEVQGDAGILEVSYNAAHADVLDYLGSTGSEQTNAAMHLEKSIKEFSDTYKAFGALKVPDQIKAVYLEMKDNVELFTTAAASVVDEKDAQAAQGKKTAVERSYNFLNDHLDKLKKIIDDTVDEVNKKDAALLAKLHSLAMIFGAAALLLLSVTGWFIARSINVKIDSLINELSSTSQEVQQEASQISDASRALAEASSKQAASLEETAASIEEVSSMVRQTADNSVQAKSLSQEVETASVDGVNTMQQMASAIDSIKVAAEETATIVKTIDEIAFQTNLLALNAAVEAARAGDAGKGFAVVAEEVRSLAQRSSVAAKDTADKIRRSRELAGNGVKVTSEMKRSLELMKEKVMKTTCLINEIAAANQEQSVGLREVNKAASHLDVTTQQNAAQSEELSAASNQLLAQSGALQGVVNHLTEMVHGTRQEPLKSAAKPLQTVRPSRKDDTKIVTLEETPAAPQPVKISANGSRSKAIELKPQQVIPLDDGDFQGF